MPQTPAFWSLMMRTIASCRGQSRFRLLGNIFRAEAVHVIANSCCRRWSKLSPLLGFVALLLVSVPPVRAQTAQFAGTVLADAPQERPLANVEITFTALNRSVRSDGLGNFLFAGLPFGKHAITVRLVGYETINTEVTLNAAKPPEVDLMLKPLATTLAKVEVKAAAPSAVRLAEFEDRRASNVGKYLTAADFEKNEGRSVSGILQEKIAGLRAVPVNGRSYLASLRGGKMYSCNPKKEQCPTLEILPLGCYMQVVVNGIIRYNGQPSQPMFDIDELNTKDIIGFEFYTTATTPSQYNASRGANMSSCGTVIIWTKY